jgi:hypothetical protein
LRGTVLDPWDGIIAGADVTIFSDYRVLTTKTNGYGSFEFALVPPNTRYIEASSQGFASVSIAVTGKTAEHLSFALWPGQFSGPTPLCSPPRNVAPPSASYEERSRDAHLTGSVTDPSGAPLANTSLTLSKVDFDAPLENAPHPYGLSMRARAAYSRQTAIAEIVSNAKGEFQFAELDPGWYTLKAARDGYSNGFVEFWIARENLTSLSRIYLSSIPPNCR